MTDGRDPREGQAGRPDDSALQRTRQWAVPICTAAVIVGIVLVVGGLVVQHATGGDPLENLRRSSQDEPDNVFAGSIAALVLYGIGGQLIAYGGFVLFVVSVKRFWGSGRPTP